MRVDLRARLAGGRAEQPQEGGQGGPAPRLRHGPPEQQGAPPPHAPGSLGPASNVLRERRYPQAGPGRAALPGSRYQATTGWEPGEGSGSCMEMRAAEMRTLHGAPCTQKEHLVHGRSVSDCMCRHLIMQSRGRRS